MMEASRLARTLREGALPAIVMLHPISPGQVVALELGWDWELQVD